MRELSSSGRRGQKQVPYPIFKDTSSSGQQQRSTSGGLKLNMNGLGVIQRLRKKSGSTSGEA
jgi:hypothetical protein